MTNDELQSFAQRYAKAWCSDDAGRVAAFFAEGGSLTVNDGPPAVGRSAIAAVAQGFIDAFPDMIVSFDRLERAGERVHFHWTLTGTNTGPGGTGKFVRISGYEDWRIGGDGRIAQSLGHFDARAYERQLQAGA
jgi:uncharacterized protein (TIGR02246 family)